jgi:hypothetical protein
MAKQAFTAAQVLTAAQMTALQANDYNQTVSTKTGSYTLVATDVGTKIVMNSASATTITVNTSLFAAGDTLTLLNVGAGVCTITAGTATVSTTGNRLLVQNAGGTLYFTSAGVSVFQADDAGSKIVAYTSNATTTITAGYLVGLNTTYTFESNKYYKISVATSYSTSAGAGLILAIEVDGTSKQRVIDNRVIAATAGNFNLNGFWVGTVAAGSKTVKLSWAVLSGTGTNPAAADSPNQLIIEDLGTL